MAENALSRRINSVSSVDRSILANRVGIGLILILGLWLRFYWLDGSSLWSDEGNTWALIQRSFGRIAQDAAADIHPPGYYWLLKLWSIPFGTSAFAVRAFSALVGSGLIFVVYRLGRSIDDAVTPATTFAGTALLAALLSALNPLQIYYSQEARMYMLLALESSGLFWAMLAWFRCFYGQRSTLVPSLWFVLCGVSGLWTHYSFPIVLAAVGATILWHWLLTVHSSSHDLRSPQRDGNANRRSGFYTGLGLFPREKPYQGSFKPLVHFLILGLLILLSFAPWLLTAIERVLNWPKGGVQNGVFENLHLTLQTFVFGPIRPEQFSLLPWLIAGGLLPVIGLVALIRTEKTRPPIVPAPGLWLGLWFFAPIGLMFALGLLSDAFLKFLLVASPAWSLLVASAPYILVRRRFLLQGMIAAGAVALSWGTLQAYYGDVNARDNYAGVARYIEIIGDPATDIVVLNAPGQQDVWRYYDPGLPMLALPIERPPNENNVIQTLATTTGGRQRVFALFWAMDEADPDRIVEQWLDQHGFQGLESWQNNVRFVVYSLPDSLACGELASPISFGDTIALGSVCLQAPPSVPQMLQAGDVALVGLNWRAGTPVTEQYKVTVQLLDDRNQVVAQHDSVPAGGTAPTNSWQPGAEVVDNHGLTIPFGTPPGEYRLIVAMYNPADGQRLPTPTGTEIELGTLQVVPTEQAIPTAIVPMLHRTDVPLGPVILAGYNSHRKEFSHAPETPIQPGDLVHFTFFWQTPDPLPTDWDDNLQFTLQLGDETLHAPLAGDGYPTGRWQAGELVRGEFDMLFDSTAPTPVLQIGSSTHKLRRLPD